MNDDKDQRIEKLEQQVQDLLTWKAAREKQQITFPLDVQSQTVLQNYFMRIVDTLTYIVVGAEEHVATSYVGEQGLLNFEVTKNIIFPYTVNATSNVFTVPEGSFIDDTAVYVYYAPGGAVPDPLAVNTQYYIRDSTGTTFKLAATAGGAAIDITNDGTGRQFIQIVL